MKLKLTDLMTEEGAGTANLFAGAAAAATASNLSKLNSD